MTVANSPAAPSLARIRLDVRSSEARRDMTYRADMKKTLCTRLVGMQRSDAGMLWRWEPDDAPTVLVQSLTPMQPSGLPDRYFVEFSGPADMARHLDSLNSGDRVAYRLTVNALIGRTRDQPGPHKRYVRRDELRDWWDTKSPAKAGLAPEPHSTQATARLERLHRKGTLWVAQISGVAAIADIERLRAAIRLGVGHAKAYGCGLLTVTKLWTPAPLSAPNR